MQKSPVPCTATWTPVVRDATRKWFGRIVSFENLTYVRSPTFPHEGSLCLSSAVTGTKGFLALLLLLVRSEASDVICPFRGLVCSLAEEGGISYVPDGPSGQGPWSFMSGRAWHTAECSTDAHMGYWQFPLWLWLVFRVILTGRMGFPSFPSLLSPSRFKSIIRKTGGVGERVL